MKYLSVCSGIEAATVAWHQIGWEPLAFSEIEPFPRKVLAHHYPDVPCYGDFTKLREMGWIGGADLLVGGTPCQAFSVAGLRQSLDDDRGNLTLEFVRLADAIDNLRHARGDKPAIIVWENVPGVLSVKDNAFGCFLAALVGNDAPLIPTGGKWTNAGMVIGPQRSAAWRVLDAQYFGVAQRRRRVFVVAGSGDGFDPAEILFEREGMRRNSAPSRKTRKDIAEIAGTIPASGGGTSRPGGQGNELDFCIPTEVAKTLTAGIGQRYDPETESLICGALGARTGLSQSVQDASAGHMIVHGTQDPCVSDIAFAQGRNNGAENVLMQPIAVDIRNSQINEDGPTMSLQSGGISEGRGMCINAIPHALTAMAVGTDCYNGTITGDISMTLKCGDGNPAINQPTVMQPVDASATNGSLFAAQTMAVRRLTPKECERLQGFPDDYTDIPKAADGPRYKALGNSMAVPVMRWIGERIQFHYR